MTHSTGPTFGAYYGDTLERSILAPFRALDTFARSIISSNRLAKEVENLLHASDDQLDAMGVKRNEIAQFVATRYASADAR